MAFELDLDSVKKNQHAKYLGQRSCNLQVVVWSLDTHTHTHTGLIALARPLRWSVMLTVITITSVQINLTRGSFFNTYQNLTGRVW